MKEIVDKLFNWIDKTDQSGSYRITDTTVYRIDTQTNSYLGQIFFQDDIQIKVKVEDKRVIKILKQNIQRVTVVKPV